MRGTTWLIALGCAILLSLSGCCGFLHNGGCGCQSCGGCEGECGPACGPVHRPYRQPVYADDCGGCASCGRCASCGEGGGCSDDCGCCCQRNFCFNPFRWIGGLFCVNTWCGPRCCNVYRGEVLDDPADCCEPCDHAGHYTGRPGCASCNRGGMQEGGDMSPLPEGATLQDDAPALQPTPAPPPKATRRIPPVDYGR